MMQAEYYPKQNVVSLSIELSSWAKAFLTDLRISKNLLSCTKASIIIKKKKQIRNFHLYKIKLRLLYDSSSNRPDVSVEGEKLRPRSSPLDDPPGGKETRCDSPLAHGKGSFCNTYTNTKGGNKNSVIYNEENEVRTSSRKATNFERNDGKGGMNGVEWEGLNGNRPVPLCTKQEDEAKRGAECTPMIQNAKIKSIHFMLKERLIIYVLLDLIVVRKKNDFVQSTINKELHYMLKMGRNVLQCKWCSKDVIICEGVNFILPNLYLNTADFLEHAFCEECTTISFDGLKDVDRNIFLFPNCLFFHFSLVKESHLAIKTDSLHHFRFLLFCNFCYNSLGYLENQRNHTYSNYKKKKMSDNLKDIFLGSIHEGDQGRYTQLNRATMTLRCGDLPPIHFNEERENLIHHLDVTPEEKQHDGTEANGVLLSEENFHEERKHTGKKGTQNDSNVDLRADHSGGSINPCGEMTPKMYLLKHKIKMTLNGENIFKNYNHVLFLNEYMHYKCEKKNTTLFYLRSNQKRKIIEVRIFIRTLYICKIGDDTEDLSNFLGLQKVMKIFFCTKGESELKFANSETIDLSRELYEDVLKMLVAYSFQGCAPGAKLFSYLHLVH
ncbi:hypothetical protein PCYB_124550 [Plasmodium cynomolgi strain B]|uniref:Uncharacterized protein n=1 Tax=Plasmodium cynomolgi (strain B) TaxID=1120755 RepID=K6UW80_PLACD|nr:hypothetical protein PCYB_124550 [Plasmodium cynomolgi strain B]GAB67889.1 hypothetical protein PCYB_124550 [Plasmodium cynomolgi strain B]